HLHRYRGAGGIGGRAGSPSCQRTGAHGLAVEPASLCPVRHPRLHRRRRVRYVGASWDGMDELKTPSTTLFDAMIGYNRNNWGLALNATNLEDERYYTTCLARGDCFLGSRRTLVGTLSYQF